MPAPLTLPTIGHLTLLIKAAGPFSLPTPTVGQHHKMLDLMTWGLVHEGNRITPAGRAHLARVLAVPVELC